MHRPFSLPTEQILTLIFVVVLKSCLYPEAKTIQDPSVVNWCTERHCQNCAKSNFLLCSNEALSKSCGDLCGCCQSCVQFRDFGESCGSQLAFRSSTDENFEDSKSRVTVIATSHCKRELVCINFICQRRNEQIDSFDAGEVEIHHKILNTDANAGFQEFLDSKKHYNHKEFDEHETNKKITLATSTAMPWPIYLIAGMLLQFGSHKNKFFSNRNFKVPGVESSIYTFQELASYNPKILFGPSRRFLNLIIADREFQLVYGHDALADLKILLNSVDKSQANSILDEIQAATLYERFKNIVDYIDNTNEISRGIKEIDLSSKTLKRESNQENENKTFFENVLHSRGLDFLKNSILTRTSNSKIPRVLIGDFREKREAEDDKVFKEYAELEDKSNGLPNAREIVNSNEQVRDTENIEFFVDNFAKETPRTMEEVDRHWQLVARDVDADDKLPTGQRMEHRDVESAINIHITGVPTLANTVRDLGFEVEQERDRRDESVEEDYGSYDGEIEVFVTDANLKFPFTRIADESRNLENFTKVKVSETYKNVSKDEVDNVTVNRWDTSTPLSKISQFSTNEFTFPENPMTVESDSLRELGVTVNETVDEFRARLDRIEMRVVAIGSTMFDIFSKFQFNEKSRIVGEKESKDSSLSSISNANTNGRRRTAMDIQSFGNVRSQETNQFIEKSPLTRQRKRIRIHKENAPGTSHHRQWRTVVVQPNLTEVQKNLKDRRMRPNRARGNIADSVSQQNYHRKNLMKLSGDSEEKSSPSITQGSSTRKWLEEDTSKLLRQSTSPKLLSKADYRNFPKYSLAESSFRRKSQFPLDKLFSRDQSSFESGSDPSLSGSLVTNQRTIWPLNPVWNRALSLERNKRTSTPETPVAGESIFELETQIPRPKVRSDMSKPFDHQLEESSMGLESVIPVGMAESITHSLDDEFSGKFEEVSDDWYWDSWDDEPSFNLFIVEGHRSADFGLGTSSSDRESSKSLVLPVENTRMDQGNHEGDDSWDHIYPKYLDYSEKVEKDEDKEPIIEPETTETPVNYRRTARIDSGYNSRKKRSVDKDLQGVEKNLKELNDFKENSTIERSIHSDSNKVNTINENISVLSTDFKDKNEQSSEKTIPGSNLFQKRSRRRVRMVDWLRAAQEYHERLHQVRNAALKTWLASRAELEDTNLTNVKLFTREVPFYLNKYKSDYIVDDDSNEESEESRTFSVNTGNSGELMMNVDEVFGKIVPKRSSYLEDTSKENDKRSTNQNPEISSSDMPRKFTIITTGNSTIRIEEMPKNIEGIDNSWLDDQSGQGSINSELRMSHQVDSTLSENEYFDHMYESFDTDDEDFEYGDPNFTMSRLLDEVDIIDDSNVDALEDGIKSSSDYIFDEDVDVEDDEVTAELRSRTKRDSPFLLFKAKGNPNHEVLIWPSNWKELISRHLKLNRSRTSIAQPQRTSRRSYVKLSKINSKLSESLETSGKSSHARDAG